MEVLQDWTGARMQDLQQTWLVRAALPMPLRIGIQALQGKVTII